LPWVLGRTGSHSPTYLKGRHDKGAVHPYGGVTKREGAVRRAGRRAVS
jgi:hypothetical protein